MVTRRPQPQPLKKKDFLDDPHQNVVIIRHENSKLSQPPTLHSALSFFCFTTALFGPLCKRQHPLSVSHSLKPSAAHVANSSPLNRAGRNFPKAWYVMTSHVTLKLLSVTFSLWPLKSTPTVVGKGRRSEGEGNCGNNDNGSDHSVSTRKKVAPAYQRSSSFSLLEGKDRGQGIARTAL